MLRIIIKLFLLIFCFASASAQMNFVHPGANESKEELDFVKAKIQAGEQPWLGNFNQLKFLASGGSNALAYINSDSNDASISREDAKKAYANALVWYYTNQEIYAQRAIAILNAWTKLQGFTAGTDQDKLQAGWIGALFGPAAEIMRGYSGWAPADMLKVQNMFKRAFYPQLNTASEWNGNVDLTQIDAMMSIAVFCEDETEFNLGLARLKTRNPAFFYLASDPAASRNMPGINFPEHWGVSYNVDLPTLFVDGLTQETCRDNNHHSQYAMASAFHAAEVAWHQGVDVYTENTARYTATLELMATQLLTGKMQGTCVNNITTKDIYDTWEVGFNHYHTRMGIPLPKTEQLINEVIRSKGVSEWNIFYETLTHGDIINYSDSMPVILFQPQSVLVANESTTTFAVVAMGQNPLTYQWKKNGEDILDKTTEKLTLTNISNSDEASYSVVITNGIGSVESSIATITVVELKPYTGNPTPIPGRLEAENFDIGGELISYHDKEVLNQGGFLRLTEGVDIKTCTDIGLGYYVGDITTGEWLTYTINVAKDTTYTVTFRMAANVATGKLSVDIDGVSFIASMALPNTAGIEKWQNVTIENLTLTAGIHHLRVNMVAGAFNINYVDFAYPKTATELTTVESNYFEISPNPSSANISIKYDNTTDYTITLTNINGKTLLNSIQLNSNTIQIINETLSTQSAGLYVFSLYGNGAFLESKTLLKQ
jgi:hypothetical protein